MRARYILTVPFLVLCLLLPALAYSAEPVRIGDITAFTGEVLARTQGVWGKVKSAPHPVYADDKIVTRRGRAEIAFVDGGLMRLNLDSNISIEQSEKQEGFIYKSTVSVRQISILVGEVWFDIKVQKGKRLKFRTPTMTAAVRGSGAIFKQGADPNKPTDYTYLNGDIDTSGSFNQVPGQPMTWDQIRTNATDLPPSNPDIDNSAAQQSAGEATKSREKATDATNDATKDNSTAQATDDPSLQALANASMGDAAVLDKQADMTSEQDRMLEARIFGDVDKINEIQDNIGQLGQEISRLEQIAEQLGRIKEEVDKAVQNNDLEKAGDLLNQSDELIKELPSPTGEPTETTKTDEELAYTKPTITPPTIVLPPPPPPDTQDLGTSSPGY